ncbi:MULTISPECIES: chitobiase/beta-hexosaminidase C-terminal domain-containing protein [Oscillospiraceae]|uniref:chitobiase/beta-hexosaminidase C-terminal domain-containing protein n=1 Tax=Oscillospiraceae TaxID=216572 RepID=UPI001106E329|nr:MULTISPECIES: chitobiase/beta-hexosaminidase C-terminal domain-containing protein [Oscillospiraceae]
MQRMTNPGGRLSEEEIRRRRRRAKAERMRRKRRLRRILILGMILILAAIIGIGVLIYRNTYTGVVNQGKRAEVNGNSTKAEALYQRAIEKNGEKEDAYISLAKLYHNQDQDDQADSLLQDAVNDHPDSIGVYRAAVEFYEDTEQTGKIAYIMSTCTNDQILTELKDYVAKIPEFSLDEDKVYDNVQELTLSSEDKGTIYYTLDGSEATVDSIEYKEPIQLNKEGETTVRAIFVNRKGIASVEVQKTYTIQFPVADAPAVSPTTGQYSEAVSVEIQVPEGYTAYYTLDGTEPSDQSIQYTGAFAVYEDTELNVVLIDGNGKKSEMTTRKYRISS